MKILFFYYIIVFKFWNAVVQISIIADAPQKSARNQMDH